MADVRISALPQQQTALTGLELVPIVQNGLTVQTTISLINALSAGGVTTFSGGATGLLPSSPTVGAITLAGMLNATYGGTGIAAYAAGDLLRANSATTLQRLAIGTNGQVLTVVAGAPAWAAVNAGTVTSVSGTGTVNGLTLTGTVTSSGNLTLGGVLDLSSPPAIGGTAAAAGTFTTLRVNSTISLAGSTGTAGYVLTSQGASAPTWTAVSSGSGNVVGPASATANGIALFDGTTGLLLKNSSSVDALIQGMTLGLGSGTGNFASTALGVNALLNNTTGSYNVAFGYDALSSNTTGEYHAAFGFQALDSQTTGTENTAVGYWALQSTTIGGYNTAVGGFAGSDLTTGSNNLFLGVNSGNNLTTGANNVYIGNCFAFSPSESDVIAFGNGAGERFRITNTGAWYINADTGTSGQVFTSNGSTTNPTWTSLGTMAGQNRDNVDITGGYISGCNITVADNVFTLQDNVDPTKQAQFQLSGLTTGTTITYTLPATATTLAGLAISNTFTSTNNFGALNNSFGTYAGAATSTTGLSIGAQTGTKTVNIGTGGLSGSTTAITVGSANGSTTTMLGSTVIGGVAGSQSLQVNNVAGAVDYLQVLGNSGGFPSLSAQGASTNVSIVYGTKGTGTHNFTTGGLSFNQFVIAHTASAVNQLNITGSTTGAPIIISAQGSDTNVSLAYAPKGTGRHTFYSNSGTQFVVGNTASAVNYTQTDGAATGAAPTISAQGSDANINLNYDSKGTGVHTFLSNGSTAQFRIANTASAVNYMQVAGSATNNNVPFQTVGTDTNIGFGFASKGLGNILFYTGSFSALQAVVFPTASAVNYLGLTGAITGAAPTISVQGSDANIGLVLSSKGTGVVALGGTSIANSGLQVQPIASSVNYFTLQGSTTSQALAFAASGTDTNIGIGYNSKGGSGHLFNTHGLTLQFYISPTASAVNRIEVTGGTTGNAPQVIASGSDTNIDLLLRSKGTGVVALGGTTTASSGFRVNPVASSVNYVQAQGGTTGNPAVVSSQGTDSNVILWLQTQGNARTFFVNSGAFQASINPVASAVNYLLLAGGTTGNGAELSSVGSDTNINLKLTAKGTGTVQFGTYTAGIVAQAGYITITDAGGTSRRLLVG